MLVSPSIPSVHQLSLIHDFSQANTCITPYDIWKTLGIDQISQFCGHLCYIRIFAFSGPHQLELYINLALHFLPSHPHPHPHHHHQIHLQASKKRYSQTPKPKTC